jgi:hypothetical protein
MHSFILQILQILLVVLRILQIRAVSFITAIGDCTLLRRDFPEPLEYLYEQPDSKQAVNNFSFFFTLITTKLFRIYGKQTEEALIRISRQN